MQQTLSLQPSQGDMLSIIWLPSDMDNLKSKYTVVILVRGSSFVVFTREIIKLIYFCYSATEELRKHPLILSVNLFLPYQLFIGVPMTSLFVIQFTNTWLKNIYTYIPRYWNKPIALKNILYIKFRRSFNSVKYFFTKTIHKYG